MVECAAPIVYDISEQQTPELRKRVPDLFSDEEMQ
jgi:hypothetical protein